MFDLEKHLMSSPHFYQTYLKNSKTDLEEEILTYLSEKNQKQIENSNHLTGVFCRKSVALFLFELSENLKLKTEIKFLAIELFEKLVIYYSFFAKI